MPLFKLNDIFFPLCKGILLIYICMPFFLHAQLILSSTAVFPESYPNFNPEFVKSRTIKRIVFDISDKKDLQVVVDKGLMHAYEFNGEGKLIRFYYTTIAKTISHEVYTEYVNRKNNHRKAENIRVKKEYEYDTISTSFYYDKLNRLSIMRYKDGNYFEATYFDYGNLDLPVKITKVKETNSSTDKNNFQLGIQTVLSEEKFEHTKTSENQIKSLCFNDEGRVYKEIIRNYNANGALVSTSETYTATWINHETIYTYNNKSKMIAKQFHSNSGGNINLKYEYDYDLNGNLLTEKHFKNQVLLNEISYINDEKDNTVKSFINRDYPNKNIRITKLQYHFN